MIEIKTPYRMYGVFSMFHIPNRLFRIETYTALLFASTFFLARFLLAVDSISFILFN